MLGYLKAESKTTAGWVIGAAGLGWFLASTYWVSHSMLIATPFLWFLTPFLSIGLGVVLAAFWFGAGFISWSFGGKPASRILWFIAIFCLAEWSRGFVATGFPWNLPGSIFAVNPTILQAASVLGVYGLNVITVLCAAAPALWLQKSRYLAVLFLALPLLLAGGGYMRLDIAPSLDVMTANAPLARLVQPAVPQQDKWDKDKRQLHLDDLVGLSGQQQMGQNQQVANLVIWPETAIAALASHEPTLLPILTRKSIISEGYLITGMPRFGDNRQLLNSAMLLGHDGNIRAIYDKRHLVPFGEFIPFRRFLPFLEPLVGPIDFSPGQTNQLINVVGFGRVQMLICYEVIFSGKIIARDNRPDLIINLTNDAWFGTSIGPWQHLYQAQMRAVEEGLPVLRAANTGISAGFDGYGRMLGMLGLGKKGALDLLVPPALSPTFYARFGDLFFLGLVFLIIATAVWVDLNRRIRQ